MVLRTTGISKSFMQDRVTASFTIDNIFDSGLSND